ncbi:RNA polymerase II [Strigomonas culicis]|nr:RNA polymerase II [Strigomonas culicis]|eukprot:EPY34178.1 RNA polymerase II [Strigomonas culicis]
MQVNPRLRLGVLSAKQWGREHSILNARKGFISPYALTIMYIYFMRETKRLSCFLDENASAEETSKLLKQADANIKTPFYDLLPFVSSDIEEVRQDVYAFFKFFGDPDNFDFDSSVIDIRNNNPVHTKEKWLDCLKTISDEERWHLLGHQVLLLRDPFESHNLGRSVDFFRGEAIREAFRTSAVKKEKITLLE